MPKLTAQAQQAVETVEAFSGDYALIEPGRYLASLTKVEVKDANHGGLQWSAEFNEIHTLDGTRQPGRQWLNLNLPIAGKAPASYTNGDEKWEKFQAVSAARVKAFFQAFGYTTDSDTDEMIGEKAIIEIEIRTIQNGPKRGQQVNGIKAVYPAGDAAVKTAGDDEAF